MLKRGNEYPGIWITFESGDGSGKGTQIKLLADYLREKGFLVETGREPGHTKASEEIRKILQDPNITNLNPRTEMLLFIAAGIEYFEEHVLNTLKKGGIFISDRWRDSTKAYQGYGLGIDLDTIDNLTRFSTDNIWPDMTFLIDIDPEIGLQKVSGNEFEGNKLDKIESRGVDYHKKVNQGYREIAKKEPERFKVIPYIEGDIETMQAQIREHVEKEIQAKNLKKTNFN